MATGLQATFWNVFLRKNDIFLFKFSFKIFQRSSLIQVMAWWHIGNKPLPDPMLIQICNFVYHMATINQSKLLTHWGRVTDICVSKLTIIGSDYGLVPSRCQAIIWTSAGILLIRRLGTNFDEILIEIYTFPFRKMHWKTSSGKW